jgi:A/G-specific adenine glycosylase
VLSIKKRTVKSPISFLRHGARLFVMPTATDRKLKEQRGSSHFTASQRRSIHRRLLRWYATHARDLPWRRTRDSYRVWVSEIMLQQTTVATVRGYFQRFVKLFPNVRALAAADESQVLRAWEGMGYYRRARQLHAAAKLIVDQHDGQLPREVAGLMELPGIGRYTAGAVASIAFDARAPILEANTIRLLSRLIAYRNDPLATAGRNALWRAAEEILPQNNVAEFNQALMELGALVCTPSEPKCDRCPLSRVCAAKAAGLQLRIPPPKPQKTYTELREAAVVVRKNGCVLLRQCGAGERWAGLWDFPRFEVEAEGPLLARDEIVTKLESQTGVKCAVSGVLKTMKHGVTRYRITLECYEAMYVGGRVRSVGAACVRWVSWAELADLPLSTTGRRIAELMRNGKR